MKMSKVFEESPFAYVIKETESDSFCHFCCVKKASLLRCAQCKFAYYCDEKCQNSARKDHSEECKGLKKTFPTVVDEYVRMMTRVLVQLKKNPKHLERAEDGGERTFAMLMSHADDIRNNLRKFAEFERVDLELRNFIDKKYLPTTVDERLQIFGKIMINSFTMLDHAESGDPFGWALYLDMSILKHSCVPDAVVVFSGPKAILNPIKSGGNTGEDWKKLRISYVAGFGMTEDRQESLRDLFYFDCKCEGCSNEQQDRIKRSLACKQPKCDGAVIVLNEGIGECLLCGDRAQDIEPSLKMMEFAKEETHILRMIYADVPPTELLDYCEKLSAKLEPFLHPFNIYYNQALHLHINGVVRMFQQGSMEQKPYLKKLHETFFRGYSNAFSRPAPEVTHILIQLADLLCVFNQLDDAEHYLRMAADEAKVTHGSDHLIFERIKLYFDLVNNKKRSGADGK